MSPCDVLHTTTFSNRFPEIDLIVIVMVRPITGWTVMGISELPYQIKSYLAAKKGEGVWQRGLSGFSRACPQPATILKPKDRHGHVLPRLRGMFSSSALSTFLPQGPPELHTEDLPRTRQPGVYVLQRQGLSSQPSSRFDLTYLAL